VKRVAENRPADNLRASSADPLSFSLLIAMSKLLDQEVVGYCCRTCATDLRHVAVLRRLGPPRYVHRSDSRRHRRAKCRVKSELLAS